jgi:hypothetical protein
MTAMTAASGAADRISRSIRSSPGSRRPNPWTDGIVTTASAATTAGSIVAGVPP